jgi:hypothetical protein
MRNLGLVFSFLVTLSLVAVALTYVPGYVGQQRIYVQGDPRNTDRDTARTAPGDPDPDHQRYYSQSEGWTYYALPSSSAPRSLAQTLPAPRAQ